MDPLQQALRQFVADFQLIPIYAQADQPAALIAVWDRLTESLGTVAQTLAPFDRDILAARQHRGPYTDAGITAASALFWLMRAHETAAELRRPIDEARTELTFAALLAAGRSVSATELVQTASNYDSRTCAAHARILTPDGMPGPSWPALRQDIVTRWPTIARDRLEAEIALELAAIAAHESPPADLPAETQQSEVGMRKRPEDGVPLKEAEVLVRKWLKAHAKGNPAAVTRDAVAAGTGVSAGQVSRTAAWITFRDKRDEETKASRRDVPLTNQMTAAMPTGNAGKAISEQRDPVLRELLLAELTEEQQADEAEQDRRHNRRHRPS